jgi:hypothetical protein
MFNFLKGNMPDLLLDAYAEVNNLDANKIRQEKKKLQQKTFIFSKAGKIIVILVGILYLFLAATNIVIAINSNTFNLGFAKYILLSILTIAVIILIVLKNKKAEIASLICIIVFIIANYMTALLHY